MPGRDGRPASLRPAAVAVALAVGCAILLAACAPWVHPRIASDERPNARPSPACSATGAEPLPERWTVDGQTRSMLVRMPESASSIPRDLVIVFHGRTNDAARVRGYVGLDQALPEAVVVYPRALPARPGTFAWSDPGDPPDRLRDFAFVDAILDAVGRAHCIDLERVFVVGHSLGASFANAVACRLGDRIRAVASVAGGLQGGPCVGRSAALILHHPDDRLVPVRSGEHVRDMFLAANGLAAEPAAPTARPALVRLRCVRHGDADAVHPVVWCPHDDGTGPDGRYYPHTWPAGAATAVAAFFARLP